ncbi:MAG: hypothetical protein H0X25_16225 [Acidobacteriales bacterium]|nr:hypothetical protein [Terriglobales bacterium]
MAPDGRGGLVYKVEGSAVSGRTELERRQELLRIIEPISGEVAIDRIEPVRDRSGHVTTYQVWVNRQ